MVMTMVTPMASSRPTFFMTSLLLVALFFADDPEMKLVVLAVDVELLGLGRLPVAHGEAVRHDAGARLQLALEDRPQPQVDVVAHVEEDHGGVGDVIDLEDVALAELDLLLDLGLDGVLSRLLDELIVDVKVDADALLGA